MMNCKNELLDQYIKEYNLPNNKIIEHTDEKLFDYYDIDSIPKGMGLADSIELDNNGKLKYGFLKGYDGEEMTLTVGYTGSGKSQRLVLQQVKVAVQKGHSAVVTDTSGQLVDYLYGYLKNNGVNVKIINFGNTSKSDRYNPLYLAALDCQKNKCITQYAETIANDISKLIVDKDTKDPAWSNGARNFLRGLIFGMFDSAAKDCIEPEEVTIFNLIEQYTWISHKVNNKGTTNLEDIEYYNTLDTNSLVFKNMASIVSCPDSTRACYISTLDDYIGRIKNSIFFDITSANTIDISDLWNKQTVIFINTADKDMGDIVSSLFINQLYAEAMEESMKTVNKKLPRIVDVFLDEFANIKVTDDKQFIKMLTTTRKMQIFYHMYIQSYAQLEAKCGESGGVSTIMSNCTLIFMGSGDYHSREMFANNAGKRTVESISTYCTNDIPQIVQLNVLNPEQLGKLKKGEIYIARQGYDIIRTYFEAAYKCKEFVPETTYEDLFNEEHFDYKNNVVIQPLMIKKVNLKLITPTTFNKILGYDGAEQYRYIMENGHYSNFYEMRKLEKLGVIKREGEKIKCLLDKEIVDEASNYNSRRKSFF